ncbi:MAG: NusG domain II-containing protein [Eubacteriales bacterium]|nr:NusG domain II-containing protein [Eubacteriales bacterium]
MQREMRLRFGRGDWLAVALVVLLALGTAAAYLPRSSSEGEAVLQVFQDGALLRELPLSQEITFEIEGEYRNTIRIEDGRASVVFSDCPGGDCMHSGAISQPGRSIACLPNRVELRVTGVTGDVDFVVR